MIGRISPPTIKKKSLHHFVASTGPPVPSSQSIITMKRKTQTNGQPSIKKRALSSEEAATRFHEGLFDSAEQQKHTKAYAQSTPYVFFLVSRA